MKTRYSLFLRRKSVYYAFHDTTKTFTSLKTKDKAEAERLLMAMNGAGKQPAMNLSLARVYHRPITLRSSIARNYRAGMVGNSVATCRTSTSLAPAWKPSSSTINSHKLN